MKRKSRKQYAITLVMGSVKKPAKWYAIGAKTKLENLSTYICGPYKNLADARRGIKKCEQAGGFKHRIIKVTEVGR